MDTELTLSEKLRICAMYSDHNYGSYEEKNQMEFSVTCGGNATLTPLTKMTNTQILNLCKAASHEVFGDYRYRKWKVTPHPKNDGDCFITMEVKNQNSPHYFQVDLIDGSIDVYFKDGQLDNAEINHTYWQWYFLNKIAIPLYPWNKTAIELGVAVDSSKLQTNEP